jgi:hypothetical protein
LGFAESFQASTRQSVEGNYRQQWHVHRLLRHPLLALHLHRMMFDCFKKETLTEINEET